MLSLLVGGKLLEPCARGKLADLTALMNRYFGFSVIVGLQLPLSLIYQVVYPDTKVKYEIMNMEYR